VPAIIPVTIPLAEPTVAVPAAPLDHVPVPELFERVIVPPWQTGTLPVAADGAASTVTVVVTTAPHEAVLVITAVPAAAAVIIPVADPIVATDVLELLQAPPIVASVSVRDVPEQTGTE
jgi:hypothetical protein